MRYSIGLAKRFIASLMFVLAIMVVIDISYYLYIVISFPLNETIIKEQIDNNGLKGFNLVLARKAGYTDADICLYFSQKYRLQYDKQKHYLNNLFILETAVVSVYLLICGGFILNLDASEPKTISKNITEYKIYELLSISKNNKKNIIIWTTIITFFGIGLIVNPTETLKWTFLAMGIQVLRVYGWKKIF